MASRSIGYARISTAHQSVEAQVALLKAEGCSAVLSETISTRTKESDRTQLQAALNALVEGDELVVAKLDRLGRDQRSVINRLHDLQERGVHIRTLDGLVSTKGLGKFAPVIIGLITGIAECERSMCR